MTFFFIAMAGRKSYKGPSKSKYFNPLVTLFGCKPRCAKEKALFKIRSSADS